MRTASSPAFVEPATDTVATGTPAGICTIDNSESRPSRCFSGTGTPMTGSGVTEANIPGRWAAPPAPAMRTRSPRSAASAPYASISFGVRCADTTRTSWATSNSISTSAAPDIVGQSESLPMTTPTTTSLTAAPLAVARQVPGVVRAHRDRVDDQPVRRLKQLDRQHAGHVELGRDPDGDVRRRPVHLRGHVRCGGDDLDADAVALHGLHDRPGPRLAA